MGHESLTVKSRILDPRMMCFRTQHVDLKRKGHEPACGIDLCPAASVPQIESHGPYSRQPSDVTRRLVSDRLAHQLF